MIKRTFVFSLALIFVLTITSAVFADAHIPACPGEAVTGTLVDFDETTNTVTIAYFPEEGVVAFCTVTFQKDADFGHPITTLLGNYFEDEFGSYDPEAFGAAVEGIEVCVVEEDDLTTTETVEYVLSDPCVGVTAYLGGSNGDGTFMLLFEDGTLGTLVVEVPVVAEADPVCVVEADDPATLDTVEYVLSDADPCEGEGVFEATVTTDNGDGTFVITFEDTTTGTLVLPEFETLAGLEEAVGGLVDNFFSALSSDGIAWAVGDDIAQRHEDGFGFGVIVKLYAMAWEYGTDLNELFDMFDNGTGMGKLFKEYGKPGLLGVGHVRQDTKEAKCNPNANPNSAVYCEPETENDPSLFVEPSNPNSNKDKTKTNNGKNNKGN